MALPPQHPTTIGNLPRELLSEILIRVPAKPLAQMRSVSKPWNHLLSQSSFIKSHLHRSLDNNKDEFLLVLLSGNNYDDLFCVTTLLSRSPHLEFPDFVNFPDDSPLDYYSVTFFGSVNGLICFCFRNHLDFFVIQIWNPSLSAVVTLPSFKSPDCFLYHDPVHQLHFRFGYDPKTDDYKLVKFMSYSPRPAPIHDSDRDLLEPLRCFKKVVNDVEEVGVYSMRNGSWKVLENRLPSHVREIFDEEVVCEDGHDGRLHWFGKVNVKGTLQIQSIVTFDLGVESFGEICLPNSVTDDSQCHWNGLGVYSGKLCVMLSHEHRRHDCEVWVMNEYGVAESWEKLHVFSQYNGDMDPYGFISSNKFLFSTFSDDLPFSREIDYDYVKMYLPGAGKVEVFKTVARERYYTKIVRYVESLVWVAPTNPKLLKYQKYRKR